MTQNERRAASCVCAVVREGPCLLNGDGRVAQYFTESHVFASADVLFFTTFDANASADVLYFAESHVTANALTFLCI